MIMQNGTENLAEPLASAEEVSSVIRGSLHHLQVLQ